MRRRRQLTIIGDLAAFPEARDIGPASSPRRTTFSSRAKRCRAPSGLRQAALDEALLLRQIVERGGEPGDRGKIEVRIAPLQHAAPHRNDAPPALRRVRHRRWAAPCRAECAVAEVAARAAGDLTELGGRQAPVLPAVELPGGREGDVIDVEIEPHSDRVGGNDVIDIAILIHVHLGIAGARRQRAENDRRAAALAPDPFGDRVDILDGKGDDRAAARQAASSSCRPRNSASTGAGAQKSERRAKARARRGAWSPAPISKVSSRPRRCSSRSVKTWPRSRSAPS